MRVEIKFAVGIGLAAALVGATTVSAQEVKIAVPSFLTGAAAPAFGIPAQRGAELIIRGINNGELPAPYNTKGLAGRQIETIFFDESGGGTKQVTELRNKVQKEGIDLLAGYISSGNCSAVARVAEELKVLTIMTTCGTSINHAVQAVGVDDSTGGYWKVRNSWSETWGESGFIRLAYGQDMCGITYDVTYVDAKKV